MHNNLTPLQAKLLESLEWFDTFCRENNLRYYAIGGTLLGAMRHSGFIPWDDDVDLGMPRDDYEKLIELSRNLEGRFLIEMYNSEKTDYCYPASKVYDTTTTLIEHKRVNVVRGVFLDIFPLDGVGNSYEEGIKHYKKIKRLFNYYLTVIGTIRKGRDFKKNMAVVLSHMVPSFIHNQRDIRLKLNSLCAQFDYNNSKYGGNLLGSYGTKEVVELSWFGEPKEYKFEHLTILGPQDGDSYLKQIYNKWWELPPVDKQVSHHDFVKLDLESSYLCYNENNKS